jgi:hypothetical protein
MRKLAAFAGSIDPLMMRLESIPYQIYFLAAHDSADLHWVSQFLPPSRLLSYNLRRNGDPFSAFNTEKTLLHSDLADVLKQHAIDALLITHRGSEAICEWGRTNKIQILATPFALQKLFEDKLWFDQFLKTHHLPHPPGGSFNLQHSKNSTDYNNLPSKLCIENSTDQRLVLQEATSYGSSGTYFFRNAEHLQQYIDSDLLPHQSQYLLRKFISGKTYGISVLLHPQTIALSALRLQCFLNHNSDEKITFAGIQWLDSAAFDQPAQRQIQSTFIDIAQILRQEYDFAGLAHFDFIMDDCGKIYIIECNPRLSSATPQLFRFTQLISQINSAKLYIEGIASETCASGQYQLDINGFPPSDFRGSLLDITHRRNLPLLIKKTFANGLYRYDGTHSHFCSADVRSFSDNSPEFIFYSELLAGDTCAQGDQIASAISNFPLFDPDGILTTAGRDIIAQFDYQLSD